MSRSITVIAVAAGLAFGCSKKDTNATSGPTGSGSTTPTTPAATKSSAANAAAAAQKNLKNACSFVPKDAAARLVPDGKSEGSQFPLDCKVLGSKSGLVITFDTGPSEGLTGESVAGLGVAAYFENLSPIDAYLTVVLGADDNGTNHNLHVALNLSDGKNHKDDTIAVAKDVLAQLAH